MFSHNNEELAQNKLILLYIIKESNYSFTKDQITEFVLEKNYMNFFSIQQYLSELVDAGFIILVENEDKEGYKLLEKGNIALDYFTSKIPNSIKEDLQAEFDLQKIKQKKETQVLAEHYQREDGQYVVNLKLVENDDTLYSLYLTVATIDQVETISNAWQERTDFIYSETIRLLIE